MQSSFSQSPPRRRGFYRLAACCAGVALGGLFATTARAAAPIGRHGHAVGLEQLVRDMLFSGAAVVDGMAAGSLDLFGAFGVQVEHADGVAGGSVQGIGFALLGVIALVIIAVGRMRMVSEHRRLDVARRLIERGLAPPTGLIVAPARQDLQRGAVWICAGIGMCTAGLVLGERGLGAAGLIPAFIGLGYVVSYRIAVGEGLTPSDHDARSRGDPGRAQPGGRDDVGRDVGGRR